MRGFMLTTILILEEGNATLIGAGIKEWHLHRVLYPFITIPEGSLFNNTIEINPELEHRIENYPWYEF